MNRRTARLAGTFLVGVMTAVLMPLTLLAAPASAAFTEEFELELVEGELLLRGAEEPHAMEGPTTLSGTNEDGNLTDIDFETPVVHVVREVPEFNTVAEIDAEFSMLSPGTGTFSEDGQLTVNLSLAVDLHIVVPILPEPSDCRASPINLTLTSTAPHDGEQVTLSDANFSIPNVTPNPPACSGLIGGEIDKALAGAGHSLTMTLEGPLTKPEAGEPTATSLEVSPSGSSEVGDDVTLTATVVEDTELTEFPPLTGSVRFFDDETELGVVPLEADGTATLVTPDIDAGPAELRAEYGGAPPAWQSSTSDTVAHTVIADPAISTDVSGFVQGGGAPTPFGVTVANTGFGEDLDDAQVKVTIERVSGSGPLGPNSGTPRLVLRHVVGGTPTPVTLTPSGATLTGTIGDASTWDLAPGEEITEALDLAASTAMGPGPVRLTFELITGGSTVGTASGEVTVVQGDRTATSITAGDPGDPPFFPAVPPVTPIVARQGGTLELYNVNVIPDLSGVRPTGDLSFTVDGRPVPVRVSNSPDYGPSVRANESFTYAIVLPPDVATGARTVEARYSGDSLFRPSQATWPVTVLPSTGPLYECRSQGVVQITFTANVEVDASLPSVWGTGRDIDLTRVGVDLVSSRTYHDQDVMLDVVSPGGTPNLKLDIGPGGTITPAEVTQQNNFPMFEDDGMGPDRVFSLKKGTGSIPFDAAPGTTTDFTLDRIEATTVNGLGFTAGIICLPVGEPASLGSVTAAGTTLEVTPGEVVGQGNLVTLKATALPASTGVVEFRDGTTTIGVKPVNAQGVATMTTRALAPGERSLTARFFGGPVATSPSEVVALHVGECGPDFTEPGNGAVVRLVYLELLGRCPDADGYEFWTERLDDGSTTPEKFALQISNSKEARGQIVIDAYEMMLERAPSAADRNYWADWLGRRGRYDVLIAELAASPEFWALSGSTNDGFVERLYDRILARSASGDDITYWAQQTSGKGKRAVTRTLFNLDEPLGVIVAAAYDDLLDRAPAAEERTTGIALMRTTSNRSALYASIIKLTEFSERAQGLPNRD